MEVFSEIRKQADDVLQTRFSEKDGAAKSASDKLESMTTLFLKLRHLNKKVQIKCKENKTELIRQGDRISKLKLSLDSMSYQTFKLKEEYSILNNL